jgi:hypothetical protein
MAKPKYKEYVTRMLESEKELFTNFKKTHDAYLLNPKGMQEALNKEGEKIMEIVRDWEDKLCRQSEVGGYGSYTTNLAEKFNAEIKKYFPKIDHVGIVIKKMDPLPAYEPVEPPFILKKIEL